MTYLYYKTSTYAGNQKPNEKTIEQWTHLSNKKNPKEWEKKWGAYNPKSFGKYKDDYITNVDDEQAGWDEFDEWMSGK